MNYRNAKQTRFGTIDCEFEHPEYGWIPFTASPDDSVAVGRELYNQIMMDGMIEPYVEPDPYINEVDIQAIKQEALRNIDRIAENARAKFVTSGAGQEMIYLRKEQEARNFKTAGYPETDISDYPYIEAEAEALESTGQVAADAIIAQADAWNIIGIQIEKERIRAKRIVREKMISFEITEVVDTFNTTIDGIVEQ